jgi:16S rRNA (uracil1498-N3)-methyltransferase
VSAPRIHVPRDGTTPWQPDLELSLPDLAARHVQVLRLQPHDALVLFDGFGGQWQASVAHMGRQSVRATLFRHEPIERELRTQVHVLLSLTANERMDAAIEKATELGVARITPVLAQRSVLRLHGERADKRLAHWRAVAASACEQCGRNRLPVIDAVVDATAAFGQVATSDRWLLSLGEGTQAFAQRWQARPNSVALAVGPEGGWSAHEEQAARAAHWLPTHLGTRVLRADTAPLAALGVIALTEHLEPNA